MGRIIWHAFGLAMGLTFAISTAALTDAFREEYVLPILVMAALAAGSFIGILRYAVWYRS
jgi:hypothetical protein